MFAYLKPNVRPQFKFICPHAENCHAQLRGPVRRQLDPFDFLAQAGRSLINGNGGVTPTGTPVKPEAWVLRKASIQPAGRRLLRGRNWGVGKGGILQVGFK